MRSHFERVLLLLAVLSSLLTAQISSDAAPLVRAEYVLSPEDVVVIRASDAEELSDKPMRIDSSGYLRLPLVGNVRAEGLTLDQLETELATRLGKHIRKPRVSVSLVEHPSQTVSVIGAVRSPGVHQLQSGKTLVEVLSLAGGISPEAGYRAKITRPLKWGRIPLANAQDDPTGQFSVGEVLLKEILEAKNPAQNIVIRPQDIVSVPLAQRIYVIGEVRKPGGFTLHEEERISILQALSLAEGLARTAGAKNSKILRPSPGGNSERTEIAINVQKILQGKAPDLQLQQEDILFVPNNAPKSAALRGVEAAIGIGSALVIYRR